MNQSAVARLVAEVGRAERAPILWDLMLHYFHSRGATKLSYHNYSSLRQAQPHHSPVFIQAEGFSESWVADYIGLERFRVDPIPELARNTAVPFFWHDVGKLKTLTPQESAFMEELKRSDLGYGLAIQVFGPAMRNGYVGVGFGKTLPDLGDADLLELQMVAQLGHIRYCELVPEKTGSDAAQLSPREREILIWIARGKSNSIIADILGTSRHTVDTQIRRLFDKLDVTDRTSAAIRGVGAGLIIPGDIRAA